MSKCSRNRGSASARPTASDERASVNLQPISLATWRSNICRKSISSAAPTQSRATTASRGEKLHIGKKPLQSRRDLTGDGRAALRRIAVIAALGAAVLSILRVPVRASFLMGGTLDGAVDPMPSLFFRFPGGVKDGPSGHPRERAGGP